MWAERGLVTLSVGLRSGVRLWLARVMHSSKVLMKVAHVALSSEACRGEEHRSSWRSFNNPNVTLFRGRCATSTEGVASASAENCVWMVWTCWTRRSQYRRSSDIFVFRPSGPAGTSRIASAAGQICWVHLLFWILIKCWLAVFWNSLKSVSIWVFQSMATVNKQVYLCACARPVFQLWKNPTPPTTSVSLQRSQLGRKSAARRGWSTPDALDRLGGLQHGHRVNVYSAVKEESSAEQCATFNIAHGHLDGAFTSLPNIVLAVIVGDNTILQHEPAWLPAWGMTDNLGTHKNQSC